MLNVKQLMDDAITKLNIGDKIEITNLDQRESDSLRVRLSREITKMEILNKTLASSFWVSKIAQDNPKLFTVTFGRGAVKGLEIKIVKANGETIDYEEGMAVQDESGDSARRRKLMAQDDLNLLVNEQPDEEEGDK